MTAQSDWIWVETLFKKIKLPYQLICIFLGILIYYCYVFLFSKLDIHILDFKELLVPVFSMSIIIPYMLGGIWFLIKIMERIISRLDAIENKNGRALYNTSKARFSESGWRYIFMILLIAPFYIVDWISPFEDNIQEHFINIYLKLYLIKEFHSFWGLSLNIYIQLLGLIALILLSYILWILLNITWILKNWETSSYNKIFEESIYNLKTKMIYIRQDILKVLLYYFICISLAIFSYFNPKNIYILDNLLLITLLLIGFLVFFFGLNSIQRTFKYQVSVQLENINEMIQEQNKKIKTIMSNDPPNKVDELNYILSTLDIFRRQKEDLQQLNTNIYDIRSILRFIGYSVMPFITGIIKFASDNNLIALDELKTWIQLKINDIINSIINYFF